MPLPRKTKDSTGSEGDRAASYLKTASHGILLILVSCCLGFLTNLKSDVGSIAVDIAVLKNDKEYSKLEITEIKQNARLATEKSTLRDGQWAELQASIALIKQKINLPEK